MLHLILKYGDPYKFNLLMVASDTFIQNIFLAIDPAICLFERLKQLVTPLLFVYFFYFVITDELILISSRHHFISQSLHPEDHALFFGSGSSFGLHI